MHQPWLFDRRVLCTDSRGGVESGAARYLEMHHPSLDLDLLPIPVPWRRARAAGLRYRGIVVFTCAWSLDSRPWKPSPKARSTICSISGSAHSAHSNDGTPGISPIARGGIEVPYVPIDLARIRDVRYHISILRNKHWWFGGLNFGEETGSRARRLQCQQLDSRSLTLPLHGVTTHLEVGRVQS